MPPARREPYAGNNNILLTKFCLQTFSGVVLIGRRGMLTYCETKIDRRNMPVCMECSETFLECLW